MIATIVRLRYRPSMRMARVAEAALQVRQPVTTVGYGLSDDELEPYGIKR